MSRPTVAESTFLEVDCGRPSKESVRVEAAAPDGVT